MEHALIPVMNKNISVNWADLTKMDEGYNDFQDVNLDLAMDNITSKSYREDFYP